MWYNEVKRGFNKILNAHKVTVYFFLISMIYFLDTQVSFYHIYMLMNIYFDKSNSMPGYTKHLWFHKNKKLVKLYSERYFRIFNWYEVEIVKQSETNFQFSDIFITEDRKRAQITYPRRLRFNK